MKQAVYGLVGLVMLFSLASCSKEVSKEASSNPNVRGTLKMKIDGTQWVALKAAYATIKDGTITITGVSNDDKSLLIELVDNGPATYTLDQQSGDYAAVTNQKEASPVAYATDEGQDTDDAGGDVIITKIDQTNKSISGTFAFKVYRDSDNKQLVITEGVIENLRYSTDEPAPNPGGGTVTPSFAVKIDGTAFAPSNLTVQRQNSLIVITATQVAGASAKIVMISMLDNITSGPPPIDFSTSGPALGMYTSGSGAGAAVYQAETGKLTITEHNTTTKVIKGTFNFEGTALVGGGTTRLTEGSFTIQYP